MGTSRNRATISTLQSASQGLALIHIPQTKRRMKGLSGRSLAAQVALTVSAIPNLAGG